MDPDVALLSSYVSYLNGIATNMAPLSADITTLQTAASAVTSGTNLTLFSDITTLQAAIAAVNQTVVNEYAAILQQSAADLQDLISGQLPSTFDPTSLNTIAAWLTSLGTATAPMQSAASDVASTTGIASLPGVSQAVTDINTAYNTIYQSGLNPTIANLNLTRIVGRMNTLAAGLTAKPRVSNPPVPPGVKNGAESGNGFLYFGLTAAVVAGGWWLMKKGHALKSRRSR
jgi:hypothetical protein